MADWNTKTKEGKIIMNEWFNKIAEVGHGKITIIFNKDNGKIDIRPELSIQKMEEHSVFIKKT